nr:LamG-like jellyroll fold domain-containing protein [Arthrobacter zhangbolii]
MGGEFTTVNGKNQQGLAVFAKRSVAPNKIAPVYSATLKPTVVSRDAGTVRVSWPSTWDYDDATLTYDVLRDNSLTAIASIDQKSSWWRTASLGYEDHGQSPGSSHTYRIRVRDPWGNEYISPRSEAVTVSATSTGDPYSERVISDGAQSYYRLDENSSVALDRAGFADADRGAGISRNATGAVAGNAAAAFDGSGTASIATRNLTPAPNTFSLEAWFQTDSTSGGYIAGFGDARTGNSGSHDRHIWMDNSGRIWFGTWLGSAATVNSAKPYNDGKWHHVTVTLGPSGTVLYVDGVRVSSRTDVTSGQAYNGYWRIGGDNLSGWPGAPASNAFKGNLDEVAVYPTALASSTVMDHYKLSGRTAVVPATPTDGYGKAVYQDEPAAYWRLEETAGDVAADAGQSGNDGLISGTVTRGAAGGVGSGKAFSFGGSDGAVAATAPSTNPTVYSAEAWFKTATTRGGKIIGFGNRNTGSSNNYDRHVYMLDDGRLVFGTYTGAENIVTTGSAYNNDAWHHVVATQSAEGMKLYVDGQLVGTNPQTGAESYTGYWRIGGDSTWGGASSGYFSGSIDEAAVYTSALPESRIRAHYAAGGGTTEEPVTAAFTSSAAGRTASFDASASTPGGEYAWDYGDGTTGTGVSSRHTYTRDGTFTVKLTVTAGGRTVTQSAQVTVGATVPTAAFTVESTALTARFDATGSSDAEGPLASYAWDFGDGTSGTGATVEHEYESAGTYRAVLTVVDSEGATASTQKDVQVAAPAAAAYAVDTFSRTSTSGWGAAEQGGNYNHPGSKANFTVENGIGRIRMSAAGSGPSVYLDSGTYSETEMQVQLGNDKQATGGGIYHHLYLRDVAGAGSYTAKVRYLANGTVNVSLNRDGTFIVPEKAVPGLAYQVGDKLSVRAQATGTTPTTLRIKVWKSGTTEPAGWQLSTTDNTAALQVPGRTGVGVYLSGSASNAPVFSLWDNLWIGAPKP